MINLCRNSRQEIFGSQIKITSLDLEHSVYPNTRNFFYFIKALPYFKDRNKETKNRKKSGREGEKEIERERKGTRKFSARTHTNLCGSQRYNCDDQESR